MAAETWLGAAEAIELGLADEVVEQELVAAKWDLSKFSKVPDGLKPHSVPRQQKSPRKTPPPPPPEKTYHRRIGTDIKTRLQRARSGV
jgi:hypothetical protein